MSSKRGYFLYFPKGDIKMWFSSVELQIRLLSSDFKVGYCLGHGRCELDDVAETLR